MEIHELARWSAWPCLLCYSTAVALRIGPKPAVRKKWADRIWLAGWITLVIHVTVAMGTAHHWSLEEATSHTAKQTQAAVGWYWGGGVWLNFLTVALWGWTLIPQKAGEFTTRVKWIDWAIQAYLAFMLFNATVVFGSRAAQVAGALICALLIWQYSRNQGREATVAPSPSGRGLG